MYFFLTTKQVYEEISGHFDETRHKQWPNVAKFIESIDTGGLLLDVGCGNGKYLHGQPSIFKVNFLFINSLNLILYNNLQKILFSL